MLIVIYSGVAIDFNKQLFLRKNNNDVTSSFIYKTIIVAKVSVFFANVAKIVVALKVYILCRLNSKSCKGYNSKL